MARPLRNIDPEQVEALAEIGCKISEMEIVLNCSRDTLERRFAATINKGRHQAKISLRRKQWQVAMAGNPTMLIFLGKQFLGQSDKQQISGPESGPVVEIRDARDRIAAKLFG